MFYISVSVEGTLLFYLRQKTVFKSADESPKFDIKEGSKILLSLTDCFVNKTNDGILQSVLIH
jgi:hypothetical protein